MSSEGFRAALKKGKAGERFVMETLTESDFPYDLEVSNNQRKGDLMFDDRKGIRRYIEVKTDFKSQSTRNVALELWSNLDVKYGWCHWDDTHYQYEFMAVHLPNEHLVVVFKFDRLKEWVKHNVIFYDKREQRKYNQKNVSINLIVPTSVFLEAVKGKQYTY